MLLVIEMFMARAPQPSTDSKIKSPTEAKQDTTETVKTIPALPTEIWLQIMEQEDQQHLWLSVRSVSHTFKDRVERLFTSKYLHNMSIALSLPRRDPATGKMRWPGDSIPRSQLKMAFVQFNEDGKHLRLESSTFLIDKHTQQSVEELRASGTLPKERLEEAPAYVNMSTYSFTGITIQMPVKVEWNDVRKIWSWDVEWRKVLNGFYAAKEKRRARGREPNTP